MINTQFLQKNSYSKTHAISVTDNFLTGHDCDLYIEEILHLPKAIPVVSEYDETGQNMTGYETDASYKVCDVVNLRFNSY